jgi:hypothetical protein
LHFIWYKFYHKISRTSLPNLASKLILAENWRSFDGFSLITLKFQVICWDIYYFSERLWCRLSNRTQKFTKLALCKKICEEQVSKAVGTVPKNGSISKTAPTIFLKIPILECGKCPLKPLILSFCVAFNFINSL